MCEENFCEMRWALEELKNTYILLKAYSDRKSAVAAEFCMENLKCCEKLLCDMAEQYSTLYFENVRLILKSLG